MKTPSPALVVVTDRCKFKSAAKWDAILTDDVRLSERFESVKRTIYSLGFTCVVVMGIDKVSRDPVAIKVILKEKLHSLAELLRARYEKRLHSSLSHPNIVPYLAGEETEDSIMIVTPLAKGDLYSLTMNKVLSESNCRRLCVQLLASLDYLHSTVKVVHGDIKPQNVLVFHDESSNKYTAQLCDFGFTEPVVPGSVLPDRGMRGSLGYFSPEQLRRDYFGQPVDMFALGIMMYQLLCGYEAFFPSNKVGRLTGIDEIDSKILQFDSPYWDHISIDCHNFLRGLLHADPNKRFTTRQALDSPWIATHHVVPDNVDIDDLGGKISTLEDRDLQFA